MSTTLPDEQSKPFVQAVKLGDAAALRALFEKDAALRKRINEPLFSFDAPALVFAAWRNDRAIIDTLLDAAADPNAKSGWWAGGFGALHAVSDRELAEHLVSRGATIDVHAAAHNGWVEKLKVLVEKTPALVHARGGDGQTPLHFARTPEIAEFLLSKGAEIDARDLDHGSTPAQHAVKDRHDVARYLMSRGATADVFMAACVGEMDYLKNALLADPALLKARVDACRFPGPPGGGGHIYTYSIGDDLTLLHAAARHDQVAVAEFLVAVGIDVNTRASYDESTPLHVAAWHDRVAVGAKLLDLGAGLELRSGKLHDETPLGWAIVAGSVGMVDFLISRGAPIEPHYLPTALKGKAGAFADYASPPKGAYDAIISRLSR